MCNRIICHKLHCDVRGVITTSEPIYDADVNGPIVSAHPSPQPCTCPSDPTIKPRLKCTYGHRCCYMAVRILPCADATCTTPTELHKYEPRTGTVWEPLPEIDSDPLPPATGVPAQGPPAAVIPTRGPEGGLLRAGDRIQTLSAQMHAVGAAIRRREAHLGGVGHGICVAIEADWERTRRYPGEPRRVRCNAEIEARMLREELKELQLAHGSAVVALGTRG
ncbi:hypothetical protein QBC33DRAFT_558686 [Phialemonium atrogriseum]|uniref:Uncharacterized protein n=1 Tax=Phialemonium atrogriseum TaxID=1093897 RepID=A0AAJ0C0E3_9PEZI|nr:uncharacterized protein QBC33DRAFT_558686 [Phialemonium atrogriseum]KAK1767858.1 hypothetical protein QBC33DRAFT_558686 [Phialemonium atrogriseum]